MAYQSVNTVAFAMPGGESCGGAQTRPIDLAHLSRQTFGDRALELEVLGLFVQQLLHAKDQIFGMNTNERLQLAHSLKGSARGVGAFAIAACAVDIEARPQDEAVLKRMVALIDETRDFVAAVSR